MNRRDLLKSSLAASAAAVVGMKLPLPLEAAQALDPQKDWAWDRSACRFCGTGCTLLVGTQGGKIKGIKGDPTAPVNRGLACIKGYYNAKILYGEDRLTEPLMRQKGGAYHPQGELSPVTWDAAFDEMAKQFKKQLQEKGPAGVAVFGSTDPTATGPLGAPWVIRQEPVECAPCLWRTCALATDQYRCIRQVTVESVCAAIRSFGVA